MEPQLYKSPHLQSWCSLGNFIEGETRGRLVLGQRMCQCPSGTPSPPRLPLPLQVGLQMLPVDGNPHKSSAFICHPDGASDFAISHDGRYIFTAGGKERTFMKWKVNLP